MIGQVFNEKSLPCPTVAFHCEKTKSARLSKAEKLLKLGENLLAVGEEVERIPKGRVGRGGFCPSSHSSLYCMSESSLTFWWLLSLQEGIRCPIERPAAFSFISRLLTLLS